MKQYIKTYKPFLLFLGKFFSVFILFSVIYRLYLNYLPNNSIDVFTTNVSNFVVSFLQYFDLKTHTIANFKTQTFQLYYNQKYIARIVEGCNAISLIILFFSFVFAFANKLKFAFLYVIFGSFLLYALNIFRIVLLVFLIDKFPNLEHLLHGVLFPAFIYGILFLLWIIWINKFAKNGK